VKYFISLDPSLAKNNKSDYSGLTVVGLAKSGKMYVVEAIERRIKPHDLIDVAIFYAIKYYDKLGKFAIETTVWQAFFCEELKKKATEKGLYIDWEEMKPKAGNDKDMRIKTLAPKFKQGYLFIRKDMKMLINELLLYPVCAHDDVIDSLCQNVACISMTNATNGFSFTNIPLSLQSRRTSRQDSVLHMLNRR
jgi:predicted phage terminase large subunit-like protein